MKFATLAQIVHFSSSSGSGSSSTTGSTHHSSSSSSSNSSASTTTSRSHSHSFSSYSPFRRKSSKMQPSAAAQKATLVEEEKRNITRYSEPLQRGNSRQLSPEEVHQDPRNKGLGRSSKGLTVRDFDLMRTLGTGTFARVWLVRLAQPSENDRDKVFALKVLRKADVIKLKQVDHVNHERSVLADVAGHPFITTLITSFSDHDSLYMLLDYCPGGEVFSYLRKAKRFSEETSRFYAAEIVLILEYLHEHEGVAYRDLKPENLLLDAEGHIKLVDFGFAKRLGNSKLTSSTSTRRDYFSSRLSKKRRRTPTSGSGDSGVSFGSGLSGLGASLRGRKNDSGNSSEESLSDFHQGETYTLCGTPEYLAPEVIQSKGHTTAVDWWALGILIYEFLTGYPPFWHQNPIEIYKQITNQPIRFPSPSTSTPPPSPHQLPPLDVSPKARSIILSLCQKDRSQRLGNISGGANRVKNHPWFESVNWDDVYNRRNQGPIIPKLRGKGDASCFDSYPDEDCGKRELYGEEMKRKWDRYFEGF